MKSFLVILFLIVIGGSSLYYFNSNNTNSIQTESDATMSPISSLEPNIEITATFKIITKGTTRIFSDSRYHNLSKDVYITSQSPNTIIVKQTGIKWSDFFKTLPMSLDKNCLVTGTKQTFCTNDNNKLSFFINNTEDPDALDKMINKDDYLLIEYK